MSKWICKNCGKRSDDDHTTSEDFCPIPRKPGTFGNHNYREDNMSDKPMGMSREAAWEQAYVCNGCEVCQFEGDGSCVPDDFRRMFDAGYDAARKEDEERIRGLVEALRTIHQVASAGCPVGEHPDGTFDAISEVCTEVLEKK